MYITKAKTKITRKLQNNKKRKQQKPMHIHPDNKR